MINGEKYKNEILEHVSPYDSFALLKGNKIVRCCEASCTECSFDGTGGCNFEAKFKWLLSEYKEPIKLSRLEYEILKWLKENTLYKYLIRNEYGILYVTSEKPFKDDQYHIWTYRQDSYERLSIFNRSFGFVDSKDEEPTLIKDVLDNCEVIKNEIK